jgi:hypothetical protein
MPSLMKSVSQNRKPWFNRKCHSLKLEATHSHMKLLLRNYNTKLIRTVSHSKVFFSVGNAAIFSPEDVCFSETLIPTYESTRHQNPEGQHRHLYHRQNVRFLLCVDQQEIVWMKLIIYMKPVSCNWFPLCMARLSS